jgi:hypothetical protein
MRKTWPPPSQQERFSHSEETDKERSISSSDISAVPSSSSSVSAAAFLADRAKEHPIEAVLESRSWMVDDGNSLGNKTEDDEFRKELERLNLSEEEVAREILAAMELFQEATEKKELSKRETSLIRMSYLDLVENGTRDSPNSTCPSDEACTSDPYRAHDDSRDPPGAVQHLRERDHQRTEGISTDSTETSSGMHFETYEDPTAELMTVDDHGSLKTNSPGTEIEKQCSAIEEISHQGKTSSTQDEENSTPIKVWDETGGTDVEKGNKDIFEVESFWEHGLWKSPNVEINTKSNLRPVVTEEGESDHARKVGDQFMDEYEDSNHTRSIPTRRKYGALEKLFLPDLRTPTEEETSNAQNIAVPSSNSKESDDDGLSAFQDDLASAYWNSRQESYEMREIQSFKPTQTGLMRTPMAIASVVSPHVYSFGNDHNQQPKRESRYRFLLSFAVLFIHAVLIVTGIVLLSGYLSSRQSIPESSHPAPANNHCATADFLLDDPVDAVHGTTLGAFKTSHPCMKEEMAGVWYSLVGTGQQIVVSVEAETFTPFDILVFSGPCSQLRCEGDSLKIRDDKGSSPTASVVWPSKTGDLYHVLVSALHQGNFSLSLKEQPSTNSECESATSIILTPEGDNVTITSRTLPSLSVHPCDSFQTVAGGSWFTIPGSGKYMTVSLCDSNSISTSTHLELFSGNCGFLECSNWETDPGIERRTDQSIGWLSNPGETYFLYVWDSDIASTRYSLCISQTEPGHTCQSSMQVSSFPNMDGRVEISGHIANQKSDGFKIDELSYLDCSSGNLEDARKLQWYRLKGSGETATATTCGTDSGNLTAVFNVYTGSDCSNLQCVQDGTSGRCGASGQQFLSWPTVNGEIYWIAVSTDDPASSGSFTLDLTNVPVPKDDATRRRLAFDKGAQKNGSIHSVLFWSVCALFAQFAWRWRKLKQVDADISP